jgi:5-formyltetrahydrofolate cyclo-ligase
MPSITRSPFKAGHRQQDKFMAKLRQLRQSIRRKRRAVSAAEAASCAEQLARHTATHPLVANSRHIATYLAADGEIDPWPLMRSLWSSGKTLYLPVLAPFSRQRLWFARYTAGDRLVVNRYGIPEPLVRELIKPWILDLVLTPLVAFDTSGNRVGMGGGYYDRSLAFLHGRQHWQKPRRLGLAYEFQKQATLAPSPWDIPMDGVATERRIYTAHR